MAGELQMQPQTVESVEWGVTRRLFGPNKL